MSHLDTTFFEPAPEGRNAAGRPEGDNRARFGANLRPFPESGGGRLFTFPYTETRAALDAVARGGVDPCHGARMAHVDPATGRPPMPTIATDVRLLPTGFESAPYRSTEGAVCVVVEGEGTSEIGGESFAWEQGDVLVVPSWAEHRHAAARESVLFAFSDRGVQQALGLWREWRGDAA